MICKLKNDQFLIKLNFNIYKIIIFINQFLQNNSIIVELLANIKPDNFLTISFVPIIQPELITIGIIATYQQSWLEELIPLTNFNNLTDYSISIK